MSNDVYPTLYTDVVGPVVDAAWLNDVGAAVWGAIGTGRGGTPPTTPAQVVTNLGITAPSVVYTPSGTGAVATTVAAFNNQIVSVFNFMPAALQADVQSATPTLDTSAAIQLALNYVCALPGSKRLVFPNGTYTLANPVTQPAAIANDVTIDAIAASFVGIAGANNGFVFTDFNRCKFDFGTFASSSSGACVLIQPTAAGGGIENQISWRSMVGTALTGYGFRVIVSGAGNKGFSASRVMAGRLANFNHGISVEVSGATNNVDTVDWDLNYQNNCTVGVYENMSSSGSINSCRWTFNIEATLAGQIGYETNATLGTIQGQVAGLATGATIIQLDAGASYNQFNLTPSQYGAAANFPLAVYCQDNSGNLTNVGMYGWSKSGASVNPSGTSQTGIASGAYTKVSFTGYEYNDGGLFDSVTNFRWLPKATGRVKVSACAMWLAQVDNTEMQIAVYKNGAAYKVASAVARGTNTQGPSITVDVIISAVTDYFEIFVLQTTGSPQALSGNNGQTWATFQTL